jgi:hypothetical protein
MVAAIPTCAAAVKRIANKPRRESWNGRTKTSGGKRLNARKQPENEAPVLLVAIVCFFHDPIPECGNRRIMQSVLGME